MRSYIYLTLAVLFGLVGSSMLKVSEGFSILWPTLLSIGSYSLAFYVFSVALQVIPLSTGYAIWSGASTALNALIGTIFFHETMGLMKITALGMIICGTIIMHHAMTHSAAKEKEEAREASAASSVTQEAMVAVQKS